MASFFYPDKGERPMSPMEAAMLQKMAMEMLTGPAANTFGGGIAALGRGIAGGLYGRRARKGTDAGMASVAEMLAARPGAGAGAPPVAPAALGPGYAPMPPAGAPAAPAGPPAAPAGPPAAPAGPPAGVPDPGKVPDAYWTEAMPYTAASLKNPRSDPRWNVDQSVVDARATLQRETGRELPINSGFRTMSQNVAAGGAPQSRHLAGGALDIGVGDMPDDQRRALAARFQTMRGGGGGVGGYPNFMHIDNRTAPQVWGPDGHARTAPAYLKSLPAGPTTPPAAADVAAGVLPRAGGAPPAPAGGAPGVAGGAPAPGVGGLPPLPPLTPPNFASPQEEAWARGLAGNPWARNDPRAAAAIKEVEARRRTPERLLAWERANIERVDKDIKNGLSAARYKLEARRVEMDERRVELAEAGGARAEAAERRAQAQERRNLAIFEREARAAHRARVEKLGEMYTRSQIPKEEAGLIPKGATAKERAVMKDRHETFMKSNAFKRLETMYGHASTMLAMAKSGRGYSDRGLILAYAKMLNPTEAVMSEDSVQIAAQSPRMSVWANEIRNLTEDGRLSDPARMAMIADAQLLLDGAVGNYKSEMGRHLALAVDEEGVSEDYARRVLDYPGDKIDLTAAFKPRVEGAAVPTYPTDAFIRAHPGLNETQQRELWGRLKDEHKWGFFRDNGWVR